MSQSWVAEECRYQAVLFLAAAAFSGRGKAGAGARGCPPPLLVADSPLGLLLRERVSALGGDGSASAKTIGEWVDGIFRQHEGTADAGIPAAPWTRAELISWWLAAGKALAVIDPHQRAAVDRMTRGGGDRTHPALWCAERFERSNLSQDALREEAFGKEPRFGDWAAAGKSLGDYCERLFKWVMLPDRERPGLAGLAKGSLEWLAALQREMRDIGDDAESLFGKSFRLRVGGELSFATADKWLAMWAASKVGGRVLTEIRRPVIFPTAEGGTKPLVKGMVVLPLAQTLVSELAVLQASAAGDHDPRAGNLPALSRATSFARSRWQPNEVVSKFWGKAGGAGPGFLPVETVERAFLAVARWLTAAQIVADVDGPAALQDNRGELTEALRIALALEGFRVREIRGGPLPVRAIPHAAGLPAGRQSLVFSREASAFEAPLGCLDEPASCPPSLFAAIEAVDWRLWAFSAAPWDREEDMTRQILDILLRPQVLRSDEWEAIKRQALHVSGVLTDEEPLAKLFTYAHQRLMAFELFRAEVYREKPAGAMLDGLIEECGHLAREALAALVAIDPAALHRLDPPRRNDGAIDVRAWLARGGPQGTIGGGTADDPVVPHRLRWSRGPQSRGEVLAERRAGDAVEVLISAGDVSDTELAVLNAPALAADWHDGRSEESTGRVAELLAGLRVGLAFPQADQAVPATGDQIAGLRAAFEGPAAAAFHELIARCRAGDEAALAWCRILQADPGFEFACHPSIDLESGSMRPPAVDDAFLAWDFDATVPAGQDVGLRFSIKPAHARRLISLGPRQPGSLADRADLLAEACRKVGGSLARLGAEARRATHRWLTFGALAPHPVGTVEPLLDELLDSEAAPPAARTAVFEAAAGWCEAIDHGLVPSAWRADGRLLPAAFPDVTLAPDFDDQAPTGTVVVRRFGLRGVHGRPFSGAVSAGPAPAGFRELKAFAERLGNSRAVGHTPLEGDLARRTDELAKHALAGTLTLALPNLYDRLWETIATVADSGERAELESAVTPLFEMLKNCCRMIPFEPTKIGEYPAGWVREPDGAQPRGRRIKRLVRPGLRTVENVLVRPALVITE